MTQLAWLIGFPWKAPSSALQVLSILSSQGPAATRQAAMMEMWLDMEKGHFEIAEHV
jgi:hypothetical protein